MNTLTESTLIWVLGMLFTLIFSLVAFIVKNILKEQNEKIMAHINDFNNLKTKLESDSQTAFDEINEIKYNYLQRFSILNTNINQTKEELLKKLFDIRILIEQNKK